MNTPIYDAVCEDLGVRPRAIKRRTHEQFMSEHQQRHWLASVGAGPEPFRARPAGISRRTRRGRSVR